MVKGATKHERYAHCNVEAHLHLPQLLAVVCFKFNRQSMLALRRQHTTAHTTTVSSKGAGAINLAGLVSFNNRSVSAVGCLLLVRHCTTRAAPQVIATREVA